MKKIIALGASNSKNSINKTFAIYVSKKVAKAEVNVLDLNNFDLPLYGIDYESENGIPDIALELNTLLEETDGLVISLAEHNGSYTASFKNAMDWLSRIDMKVWKDKPILLLATSPGGRGGNTVLQTAKSYFPFLGGNVIADFSLPKFYDNFSEGEIVDKELNESLNQKIVVFEQALHKEIVRVKVNTA